MISYGDSVFILMKRLTNSEVVMRKYNCQTLVWCILGPSKSVENECLKTALEEYLNE